LHDSPLEGAGIETSIPLTKYIGLFVERCGEKKSTGMASNRHDQVAGCTYFAKLIYYIFG